MKQLSELLLKKMNKKLEKYKNNPVVFEENFPLYMLLIVHLHRWEPWEWLLYVNKHMYSVSKSKFDVSGFILY